MASYLGVSEKAIRAQVARGVIPYRRLGGRVVFVVADIDAYLSQLPGVSPSEALANLAARNGRAS
jgi:excisionase family DNA binding protein